MDCHSDTADTEEFEKEAILNFYLFCFVSLWLILLLHLVTRII